MWDGDEKIHLPKTRTKKSFYITSFKGELFYIEPGLVYSLDKDSHKFIQIKQRPKISGKIDRVIISPCGASTLHLPKSDPFLFYHVNSKNGELFSIPFPKRIHTPNSKPKSNNDDGENEKVNAYDQTCSISYLKIPSGEDLLITNPQFMQNNSPNVIFGKPTHFDTKNVTGFSISENRNSMAIAYKNHFYVWQQCRDQVIGTGFWTDLASNQNLKINTNAITMSEKTYGNSNHGFMKPQQIFTLENPNFAPNIPLNSEIAYQDMCVFNNPDEGVGVCCLTMLLPPYRPFDRLYIFNSIANFDQTGNGKYKFHHCDTTMPIIEGIGAPCVWWSVDCRIFVLAVSNSLMIMTRHLRIIKILSLKSIFSPAKVTLSKKNNNGKTVSRDEKPLISDVSWSCQGEFFVVTSNFGQVGIVTRCGKSLKHEICALEAFNTKAVGPLLVTADSVDPSLFNIYSPESLVLRRFNVNRKRIPRDLQSLMSLHFPQTSASKLWDLTLKAILKNGIKDKTSFVRLLYYTDLFRLFPFFSPLRSILLQLFNEGATKALESGNDIFTYFVVRCIFRLTSFETNAYRSIHQMLSKSNDRKDRILYKILDDELNKRDYSITKENVPKSIKLYKENLPKDYENIGKKEMKPQDSRNANLVPLVESVINILYNNDFSQLDSINFNLNVFADLLINLDQPDKAMIVAKHPSVEVEPPQFYIRIVNHYSRDAVNLYVSLLRCIRSSPESEMELRAICLRALINILKQILADSIERWKVTNGKENEKISRLANLEKELQIVIPNNKQQLSDFAVVFSIALCAAGYTACLNYTSQKSTQIPENLRHAIRHLFKLLWFIQWRHQAVKFSSREDIGADSLLRLLAFPEFINITAVKSQLDSFPPYSKEIFKVYIRERPIIEQDPLYPNFLNHCKSKLNYSLLSKVSTTVISMSKICEKIPYSGILIAAIVSHLIPWLRCGITRALVDFKCNEFIPKELIDFEEYKFPRLEQIEEEEEEEEYYSSDSSYSYSEGEFKGETKGKIIIKQADLSQIKSSNSDIKKDNNDEQKPIIKKKKTDKKIKKKKKKKIDTKNLPLISPNSIPYNINQPPQQPQNIVVPLPIYYPVFDAANIHIEQPKEPSDIFGPIWDFKPEDFDEIVEEEEEEMQKEFIEEEEEPQDDDDTEQLPKKPVYADAYTEPVNFQPSKKTVETQFEPPTVRKVKPVVKVFVKKKFVPPPMEEPLQLSISSDESELYIPTASPKLDPKNNPFPLDDGLHKKIDDLFDDINKIPEPQKLPSKPSYVPVKRDIIIPSAKDFEIDRNKYEIDPDAFDFNRKKKQVVKKSHKIRIIDEIQTFSENVHESQPKSRNDRTKSNMMQNTGKVTAPAKEISSEQFKRDKSNQRARLTIKEIDDE